MRISRRAVAYHEAGHVVAAWSFGFRVVEGGIVAADPAKGQPGWEGLVNCMPPCTDETDPMTNVGLVHAWLVIFASGHRAQRMALARSKRGNGGDAMNAARLVASTYESRAAQAAALRLAREEAEALVRRQWPLVIAVAECLLAAQGLVPGPEIIAAVQACRCDAVEAPAPRRRRPNPSRPARRADAAAAALLVVTKLVAEQPQLAAELSIDLARAIEFTALCRDLDPQALAGKWDRVLDQESARRAWRPVGQRRAVGGVGRFEG
jgi:hypothetical protein